MVIREREVFLLRITPLHNIREPGLIPNGFQKEEASPPAPDPRMQPDMRNSVKAQSDTRHAFEILNPGARLETNGANRTNSTSQQLPPHNHSIQEKPVELNDAYERLLRILLGHKPSGQTALSKVDNPESTERAKETLEMKGTPEPANREIEAYHQAANLSGLFMSNRNNPAPESSPSQQKGTQLTYYQRKGLEAYRTNNHF